MPTTVNGRTPTYNLKAVVQETGLKPDTLRAWERRYGIPTPERTAGGHRLYSQHDIEMLKWLVTRQDEGLSISRAVDLWQALMVEGKDPLQIYQAPGSDSAENALSVGDSLIQIRDAWIDACLSFNEQKADSVLAQAFALYPIETVCLQILQRGLAEIGLGWASGNVSAQQEHFASALSMRRIENLIAATPNPTRPQRLLIGCPPEEEHIFAPLLITLLLRRRGWDIVFLGANIPLARLEATIRAAQPQMVILTAQTLPTAATLLSMAYILQQENVLLGFGGGIFNHKPALRGRIPGYFLGEKLGQTSQFVEQILNTPRPCRPVEPPAPAYEHALQHYREQQARLEAYVWEEFRSTPTPMPPTALAAANRNFGRIILAALELGDITQAASDFHEAARLLSIPQHEIAFLNAYHRAMVKALDKRGQLIIDWLSQLLNTIL